MPSTPTQRAHFLLAQMTLDEKLAQIRTPSGCTKFRRTRISRPARPISSSSMASGRLPAPPVTPPWNPPRSARFNNAMQSYLVNQTRLGIPAMFHEECCSGLHGAGRHDVPADDRAGQHLPAGTRRPNDAAIRKQMRAIGAHQGLAPVLDVARDPRWGRTEETFGEDPTLVGHFGAAYIQGLQGENLAEAASWPPASTSSGTASRRAG